jgi:hypothetical protein
MVLLGRILSGRRSLMNDVDCLELAHLLFMLQLLFIVCWNAPRSKHLSLKLLLLREMFDTWVLCSCDHLLLKMNQMYFITKTMGKDSQQQRQPNNSYQE